MYETQIRDLMQDIGSQTVIDGMIKVFENEILEVEAELQFAKKQKDKREITNCRYRIRAFKDDIKALKKIELSGEDV
jgi:hypothetical protein